MRTFVFTLMLFGMFVLEGTVLKWIIPVVWQEQVIVATQFVLVGILFVGIFWSRHRAFIYGLSFGLLHDIVYYGATMIGTYSFAMGLIGYAAGWLSMPRKPNIISSMSVVTAGCFLFEFIVYGLYRLFRVSAEPLEYVLMHQMLPSVLINLLFALLVYVPLRKWLEETAALHAKETDI